MPNKNIYILGINPSHNCSAALVKDGKLIASVSEERFTRQKNQIGLPERSIDYVLTYANISKSDVDHVVIATSNTHELGKLITRGKLNLDQEKIQQDTRKYSKIFSQSFFSYL